MTSKLVVNTIEADTGISSVSFASSISLSSTSKFFFSDAGINIGPDTNINRPATGVLGFNINSSEKLRITSTGDLIHSATTGRSLSLVATQNQSQAGLKIAFFGADRYDTDEEFAAIRGLLVSNSGGSGKQNGGLQFVVGSDSHTHAMTQGGYVGIGTGNPSYKLHVYGGNARITQPAGTDASFDVNEETTTYPLRLSQTATEARIQNIASLPFNIRSQAGSGSTAHLAFWTRDGERLRIASDGKVGINTTTPSALLDIGGNTDGNVQAIFTRGADPGFRIQAVNESSGNNVGDVVGKFGLFYSDGTDVAGFKFLRGSGTNSGSIVLTGGGNDRVHLTSGGNLVIGSNNAVPNTAAGITVNKGQAQAGYSMVGLLSNNTAHPNDAWNWGVYTRSVFSGVTRIASVGCYKHSTNNPAGCLAISQRDGGNTRVWADNNNVLRIGNVNTQIGGTGGSVVGAQTSDIRLKNKLGSVSYGLSEINQINPIKFSFKKDESNRQQIGFSAQDIKSIIPEAVFNSECSYNIEGTQVDDTLGMDYVALVPVLVNAVKELSAKVAALEGS